MNHEASSDSLDLIFRNARTHNGWQQKPVEDALLKQVYDLAKMGPTSANMCPLRIVFVRSREAKERLKPALDAGNVDKTMAAPVTAILGMDVHFFEQLPKLFPHADAKAWIAATETGLRNYIAEAVSSALTLGAVMEKHRDEILRKKPYSVNLHDNTRFAVAFANVQIIDMTDEWWIRTVQGWKVKANSAKRYVGSIVSALTAAEDLKWKVKVNWEAYHAAVKALSRQRLLDNGRPRKRRVTNEEIAAIKAEHSEHEIPLAEHHQDQSFLAGQSVGFRRLCGVAVPGGRPAVLPAGHKNLQHVLAAVGSSHEQRGVALGQRDRFIH